MKRLMVAVAVLLTLGAASAETVRSELAANKTDGGTAATSLDVSSIATVQLASSWLGHAKASTDGRLARPL